MSAVSKWSNPQVEEKLRGALSLDEPWALLERFSTLVRESGSEDEWTAARYIAGRLEALGVDYTLHEPELFLSVPKGARLEVEAGGQTRELRAKTPAFSVSTGDTPVTGEVVHVSMGQSSGSDDLFAAGGEVQEDVAGKVVLTEGYPMPAKVDSFRDRGAVALIFISPGTSIHEGICTPIWGAPDLDTADRQPALPVIAISRPDGQWLVEAGKAGEVRVSLNTWLDEGWMKCPLLEAVVPGTVEPDKFVLLHGHIDSWHVGIGDNATGDATLLEVARVLQAHREHLGRSVKICWWPGHSTGRYAGSTWYADTFALDIEENCVVHINCDSPGCRWATVYEDVTVTPDAEDLLKGAVAAATGQDALGEWPVRAGDISFNNLGVSTLFMLSSSIPGDLLQEKGYYPVGGCGMNIEWHTEGDTMEIADRDILLKDMKVYLTAVYRAASAPAVPLDYRRMVDALREHLEGYARAAAGRVSFADALAAAAGARAALDRFYAALAVKVEATGGAGGQGNTGAPDPERTAALAPWNETLLRAGRRLVEVALSERGRFRHDLALPIPPIPAVAPAGRLADLPEGSHGDRVTRTHVVRGLNQVAWAFREAAREVDDALARLGR